MSSVDNNSFPVVPYASKSFAIEHSPLYTQENLQTRMQRAMDESLKTQFRDYNHFHQYGMGDIVVLVGTSTAGKTSIIKALQELEPDRLEDGGDLRSYFTSLKVMTKYNPNEIEILSKLMKNPLDIPKAIGSKEFSWKTGITPQEKLEAEEAIQRIQKTGDAFSPKEKEEIDGAFKNSEFEMFDDAFERSRRGGDTIFDILNIDALARHLLTRNFNGPIRPILIYCPFHVLSSRMEKRNKEAMESGEFSNQRIGEFPLMQFSELYTQKGKRQAPFERLSREQVTQAFNENFDNGTNANRETARIEGRKFPSEKELSKEKAESLANFLANLGFKDGIDVVEVAPKNQDSYTLFINSSQSPPSESAKIIHLGAHQRY